MKGMLIPVSLVLTILLVGGCESASGSGTSSSSGSTGGSMTPTAPGGTTSTGLQGPGQADDYSPAAQRKMDIAWRAFKDDSPQWPELRQEWIQLGRRATSTLVENLYRAMLLSSEANYTEGYDRSRRELILLGELAVPTLTGVLKKGAIYSPEQREEVPLPTGVVSITAEIIALSGPFAVPYLAGLIPDGRPTVRRSAAAGLGQTGARSAVEPLSRLLAGGDDWSVRMVAARALGNLKFPESEAALIRALDDPDAEVVEVAARSLAQQRATGALSALDSRRQRAQAAGQHQIAASVGAAAKLIRGGR